MHTSCMNFEVATCTFIAQTKGSGRWQVNGWAMGWSRCYPAWRACHAFMPPIGIC